MVILGIDPGLVSTGYGLIDMRGATLRLIAAGDIRPPRTQPLAQRLAVIHDTLARLIVRYRPDAAVLEQLFTHARHVTTATMMGHARGVACLVVQAHDLPLAEYPTTQVKKSLAGNGHASKDQIARMVGHWLQQQDEGWSSDASDALALAIVHAHLSAQRHNLPVTFHTPHPKHHTRTTPHIPSTKPTLFGIWGLEIGVCLGFGIWNLALRG